MKKRLFKNKETFLKTFFACLLLVSLSSLKPAVVSADYYDGLAASHKGDYQTAFREFRSLAENGHVKAQVQLGLMYELGLGVAQDYNEATKWYKKAAINGNSEAQQRLLGIKTKGLTSHFQPPVPDTWKGGNTSEPESQFDIGVMYLKGIGVEKDAATAFRWFQLAANQGYAAAQQDLAEMLLKGVGVRQNETEAYIWFMRAAQQGLAESQYNLGLILSHGTESGLPQHFELAYMWFEIAARNGIAEARGKQEELAVKMDKDRIGDAISEARRWLARYEQDK